MWRRKDKVEIFPENKKNYKSGNNVKGKIIKRITNQSKFPRKERKDKNILIWILIYTCLEISN